MAQEVEGEKAGMKEALYLFTGGWVPSPVCVSSLSYIAPGESLLSLEMG